MVGGIKLEIHQAVHGYDGGHSMLASSCSLSSSEKIALLKMSDLSGSIAGGDFIPYITGYPLPGSNYYALAKTWNAPEMKRPGCVWTHTLLISLPTLSRLNDFIGLDKLLKKPELKDISSYSSPILFESLGNSNDIFDREDFDLLSYHIYEAASKSLLLRSYSKNVDRDVLNIWKYQWPALRRSFSFCTGAFSVRYLNEKPLDLQIIPRQSDLMFNNRTVRDEFTTVNELNSHDAKVSGWLQLFRNSNLEDLLNFMFKYGSDLVGGRERYVALFLAFELDQQLYGFDNALSKMVEFVHQYFPKRTEAKSLKKDLLSKLFDIDKRNEYYFIFQKLNNREWNEPFGDLKLHYDEIVKDLWRSNAISKIELSGVLQNIEQSMLNEEAYDIFLADLPVDTWMTLDWLDELILLNTIRLNPTILETSVIWSKSNSQQNLWFRSLNLLHNSQPTLRILEKIITTMIKEENDQFAIDILKIYKEEAVSLILNVVDDLKIVLSNAWEKTVLSYPELIFKWVNRGDVTYYKLSLILKMISLENFKLHKVSSDFVKVLSKIEKNNSTILVTRIFSRLLALSFNNFFKESDIICSLVFQKIHDDAKRGNIEDSDWTLINLSLPKNKMTAPDRSFISWVFGFNDEYVPLWDRCELLRRSLVECFIISKWDFELFYVTIRDVDTFERIMKFCTKSEGGLNFLKTLKKSKATNHYPKFVRLLKKYK